jgi:hypothetical protein
MISDNPPNAVFIKKVKILLKELPLSQEMGGMSITNGRHEENDNHPFDTSTLHAQQMNKRRFFLQHVEEKQRNTLQTKRIRVITYPHSFAIVISKHVME